MPHEVPREVPSQVPNQDRIGFHISGAVPRSHVGEASEGHDIGWQNVARSLVASRVHACVAAAPHDALGPGPPGQAPLRAPDSGASNEKARIAGWRPVSRPSET